MVVLGGGVVSYERGTHVQTARRMTARHGAGTGAAWASIATGVPLSQERAPPPWGHHVTLGIDGPALGSQKEGVSYERGTPVPSCRTRAISTNRSHRQPHQIIQTESTLEATQGQIDGF